MFSVIAGSPATSIECSDTYRTQDAQQSADDIHEPVVRVARSTECRNQGLHELEERGEPRDACEREKWPPRGQSKE